MKGIYIVFESLFAFPVVAQNPVDPAPLWVRLLTPVNSKRTGFETVSAVVIAAYASSCFGSGQYRRKDHPGWQHLRVGCPPKGAGEENKHQLTIRSAPILDCSFKDRCNSSWVMSQ